jgi:collagen type V/XI/XXIV/XXVII alpha
MEGIETAIQHQVAALETAEPGFQREGLEKALEELKKKLEAMRVEADEEYARELNGGR